MLKWTVINKRQTENGDQYTTKRHSTDVLNCLQDNPIQKPKRRRSSNSRLSSDGAHRRKHNRRSLNINSDNKENRFTSTPIKSPDECFRSEALRDVSNISAKDGKLKILTPKKRLSPKHVKHKKKKRCVDPTHGGQKLSGLPNYLQPLVDVEEAKINDGCRYGISSMPKGIVETYAPTLPTFGVEYSPCGFRPTAQNILTRIRETEFDQNCPPYKKAKIDHVNDFLNQISHVNSPEDRSINNRNGMELKISPLVQKLVGLRFTPNKKLNDSSYINNLSLNELVNAILDSSVENYNQKSDDAVVVNIGDVNGKDCESFSDRNSTDSGFRSNTDSHNVGANFACACKTDNLHALPREGPELSCDRTMINIDETFNERCVDIEVKENPIVDQKSTNEQPESKSFTLKRQRCIRRRRLLEDQKNIHNHKAQNHSPDSNKEHSSSNFTYWDLDNNWNDNSFDSSYYENLNNVKSPEKLEIAEYDHSRLEDGQSLRKTRRCLSFESPVSDSSSIISSERLSVTGSIELEVEYCSNELVLKVLKCYDLARSHAKSVNAYIKVCLSDGRRKQQDTLQRTPVQAESCRPTFNHTFRLPLLKTDLQKRLFVEVWHRDRICRRSKFLGCMSFGVKNVIKKNIKGHFYLLPQSTGRCQNVPMTTDQVSNLSGDSRTFLQRTDSHGTSDRTTTMCESQSSVEEVAMNLDDIDGDLKKSSIVNREALSEQQKLADENLFLRYLELDPTEGPEAIPAAMQRKATGNKNGRTPFTTTKKLVRQPKTGFGFSVVWTHPPRVERVEKGLPADRAGILPGDYIIFVDKHNVVTMPEIEILNLIRSYGNQLTLEIFRRNASRNGSVSNVRRLTSVGTESSTPLPIPSLSTQRRPSTVCSTTNTISMEYNRRKLQLPQVTFSAEVGSGVLV